MAATTGTKPVEESIERVNDEVAVGSDLEFQRKWWRFTRAIWIVFTAIVIADLLGCFGRGYFANARLRTNDSSMDVKYERIERFSTPSILRIEFGPSAIHDGKVQLWVSDTLIDALGNQRVIPEPVTSVVDRGGVLYTFGAASTPAAAAFALEPKGPGMYELAIRSAGGQELRPRIFVMP